METLSGIKFITCTIAATEQFTSTFIQGLSELADQNNTVESSSSGNNRKNVLKNPSSLDYVFN
jgi:hypothetical protein